MENVTFIPAWAIWIAGVLLVFLTGIILQLKKKTRTLEAKADAIEEIQEARRKRRT